MFLEARARILAISAWLECCYGSQPLLFLGDHTILSYSGVQQGDPLGPLAFALALHPLVKQIKREVPGLRLNSSYLDDGTLCGSPAHLSAALSLLEAGGPPRGLFLNRRKCHLIVPEDATCNLSLLPSEIPMSSGGFVLLGSPFGSSSFCTSVVLKRVAKIRDTLPALKSVQDSQIQLTLVRACLSLPKISFALRTCAPHLSYLPWRLLMTESERPFQILLVLQSRSGPGRRPPSHVRWVLWDFAVPPFTPLLPILAPSINVSA